MNRKLPILFQSILALVCLLTTADVNTANADDQRNPSVGAAGSIEQIILPGSELSAKPLEGQAPIVVRILKAFPHGDSYRYQLRFHGLEPGKYDLSKWLVRKDGSTTIDLPEISVEIKSLLPPGQIAPNKLSSGWIPQLGGYRRLAFVVALLWILGLLGIIFLGRRKPANELRAEKQLTLADLLKPRLESAMENRMLPQQYAELERMLFAFWRKRLELNDVSVELAIQQIHADQDAGPLMQQLEQWMHNPNRDANIDLADLLKPFQNLPADTPEFQS